MDNSFKLKTILISHSTFQFVTRTLLKVFENARVGAKTESRSGNLPQLLFLGLINIFAFLQWRDGFQVHLHTFRLGQEPDGEADPRVTEAHAYDTYLRVAVLGGQQCGLRDQVHEERVLC